VNRMDSPDIIFQREFDEISARLPRFPDGRTDYTHARRALALNCLVFHDNKLLVLLRGDTVGFLKGKWHVVGGFLDERIPIMEKAMIELKEETGITADPSQCTPHAPVEAMTDHKEWLIFPVIVRLTQTPTVKLDWEHTDHAWILPSDIAKYDLLPDVLDVLKDIKWLE